MGVEANDVGYRNGGMADSQSHAVPRHCTIPGGPCQTHNFSRDLRQAACCSKFAVGRSQLRFRLRYAGCGIDARCCGGTMWGAPSQGLFHVTASRVEQYVTFWYCANVFRSVYYRANHCSSLCIESDQSDLLRAMSHASFMQHAVHGLLLHGLGKKKMVITCELGHLNRPERLTTFDSSIEDLPKDSLTRSSWLCIAATP